MVVVERGWRGNFCFPVRAHALDSFSLCWDELARRRLHWPARRRLHFLLISSLRGRSYGK
jgi:hypothetical protein